MAADEHKDILTAYLQMARESMLWKLEGASDYDIRRPHTPTGTNLLGLVKHLATVESGYFGACFDRPFPERLAWLADGAEDDDDMWAKPDESTDFITGLYRRVWEHSDATIAALDLETTGTVSWWPEDRRHPTLARILVHMTAETHRHAGHADIVRELVDGSAGLRADNTNLPDRDSETWSAYHAKIEQAARDAP